MTRHVHHTIPDAEWREDPPCGHCGARLYLEGKEILKKAQARPAVLPAISEGASSSNGSATMPVGVCKKRSASDLVNELAQLKDLKDAGVLESPDFKKLKDRLKSEI